MKRSLQLYVSLIFLFILGNYRGSIALWREDTPEPTQIFPYSVSSLPRADQKALEKGIPIPSEGALQRLLEDYLS